MSTTLREIAGEARNQACVEVGPLVYCLESAGLPKGVELTDVLLPLNPGFAVIEQVIDGRHVPAVEATLLIQKVDDDERDALYRPIGSLAPNPVRATLVPYYAWDNRGWGEMSVWLPLAWRDA